MRLDSGVGTIHASLLQIGSNSSGTHKCVPTVGRVEMHFFAKNAQKWKEYWENAPRGWCT